MLLPLLLASLAMQSRAVVLTYHDVIPERGKDAVWFDCTQTELRDQLAWLKEQGANFISTEELYKHLTTSTPFPGKAICITFADNYKGFMRYGWSIIEKMEVPVTMFAHTGFVGNRSGREKMSWEDLLVLSKSPRFRVGSQTVSHPADLRKLSREQVLKEFTDSWESLKTNLENPVRFLAYPNGKWNDATAEIANEAGYLMAFTEEQKPVRVGVDLHKVPRYVHTKYREAWQDAFGK